MSQPPGNGPYVPPEHGPYGPRPWPPQGAGPAWSPPAAGPAQLQKPRSSRAWLAATSIVVGLAVIFGGTFYLGRATAPGALTPAPTASGPPVTAVPTGSGPPSLLPNSGTPTKGFTFNGLSLSGRNFTATLPSGWVVSAGNGDSNDGAAEGATGRMVYWAGSPVPAATLCPNAIASVVAAPSDVTTPVTGMLWGGLATVATSVLTKDTDTGNPVAYIAYCVNLPSGATSLLMAWSVPADFSTHRAVVEQFLTRWVWR